ncbi:MAG: hypothetical protein U0414_21225 [Polyangiaceae bacterium]
MSAAAAQGKLTLGLAYAGACAVPLLVVFAVVVRSPVRADEVATTTSTSVGPTTSMAPVPVVPSGAKVSSARPPPTPSATARPTIPPLPAPTGPKLIQSTAVLRDAIDALHKQIQLHQMHEAVGGVKHLLELDPATIEDPGVRSDVIALTLDVLKLPKPDPEDMFEMLVSSMGTTGIDILYEIMTTHGGMAAADYSRDLLAREDVRAHGSPALKVAYALKSAKNCDDVRAAFPAAKDDGDKRALGLLYEFQKRCGRRHFSVCCLEGDKELADTINAMHTRLGIHF